MSIFVIYIRWLLGNSVGLGWVGLAMPICNVGKTKLDDGTVKGEKKKKKEPLNVTKTQPYVILVLSNVTMEQSNMRKKN